MSSRNWQAWHIMNLELCMIFSKYAPRAFQINPLLFTVFCD